jgi:hypothetical protein
VHDGEWSCPPLLLELLVYDVLPQSLPRSAQLRDQIPQPLDGVHLQAQTAGKSTFGGKFELVAEIIILAGKLCYSQDSTRSWPIKSMQRERLLQPDVLIRFLCDKRAAVVHVEIPSHFQIVNL